MAYDDSGIVATGLPGTAPGTKATGEVPSAVREVASHLEAYFSGGEPPEASDDILARVASTPFLRRVYEVVSLIEPGATLTYAEVARRVGRPGAARAVGAATARNPLAPLIPCHRVVGSDGSLRGYGGGLEMKRALLAMEARRA